ncbi:MULTISPECIES: hypothetical protein [Cupriavidus]|uniref:hypothetical protein n=1 Tax=Cupriavidus sp. DF5525 TaxID=3160989 RepID=UPI0032DF702C
MEELTKEELATLAAQMDAEESRIRAAAGTAGTADSPVVLFVSEIPATKAPARRTFPLWSG